MSRARIAIAVSDFEDGGVERNLSTLALYLSRVGFEVEFLAGRTEHPFLEPLCGELVVSRMCGRRVHAFAGYFERACPDVLLTGKLADDEAALAARTQSACATKLVACVGTLMSARGDGRFNPLKDWRQRRIIRRCYERLDAISAISGHVASDLRERIGVRAVPIRILNNPIIPPDLDARAAAPCDDPWLQPGAPPVVMAIGGLRKVKDYATLLRAFAAMKHPDARLLILGEGKERKRLERLGQELGLAHRIRLPGFVADPFPYLVRARVLALSSKREGLGNVLVEAMALGVNVVATGCTSAIRELLDDGELGGLVPVGDCDALARALDEALSRESDPEELRAAAVPYGVGPATDGYVRLIQDLLSGQAIASDR